MTLTSFYPVVMSQDVPAASRFFQDTFGFEVTFEADWYVSLQCDSRWELAFLDASHPTIPEGFRTPLQGLLLNIEVEDVDAEYRRLVEGGHTPVLDIRSEDFGQRHFILAGPDNILIDVITPIPMIGEFAGQDG